MSSASSTNSTLKCSIYRGINTVTKVERGKISTCFFPSRGQDNKECYIENILEGALIPWCNSVYGDKVWTLQQDGAMSHMVQVTQQLYRDNCLSWISKEEWPLSSLGLNALDYSLWSILESDACSTFCQNIEALKKKLNKYWNKIPLDVVHAAMDDFPKRVHCVVKAQGKHFE